ncbi:FxSxx-COOH system tetratricopeptide repeat protein [Actinoplanes sp. NPDC049668]|uniref:FxSxx-COOH system tetratricopeptide repeat protein n=1 Tax=unclassified Actinoplanes TaxID=2626549 RepID=UPI0033A383DC
MAENRDGTVVTFYSYKGGTGRTMALANVAWILAASGYRVLVADWDLESPGLHRFFHPFIRPSDLQGAGGVVEMVNVYDEATRQDAERKDNWQADFARVSRYAFSLDWRHFPKGGGIDFLPAGQNNPDYSRSVYERNWDEFYDTLGGGRLFEALRADMKKNYDFALIDSRTGISDVAGICTSQLPDVLVDCFTFSEQGIDGAARVAAGVGRNNARSIRVLPVPMRVDSAEKLRVDAGRQVARQRFIGLPTGMPESGRDRYWATVEVPYQAFYAFEETLATFGDQPGVPSSMLASYVALARYVTNGAVSEFTPMDEDLRSRTLERFARRVSRPEEKVVLRYMPVDRLWAEWVTGVLQAADITVRTVEVGSDDDQIEHDVRQLTLISQANAESEAARVSRVLPDPRPPLVVYIADVRPFRGQAAEDSAFLANQSVEAAVERLLKLVRRPTAEVDPNGIGVRFPGSAAAIFNAPIRNKLFTGREADILKLRSQLQSQGLSALVQGNQSITLQGMGGIGKTQVAMEYAHRFRNAYDLVWWINASEVAFIDTQLAALAKRLGSAEQSAIPDQAAALLETLERGKADVGRWLLIFDNAEDIESVFKYLPSGPGGHVLITSRNPDWAAHQETIQMEVFQRLESVAHLQQRVPLIRLEHANRIAELLGDLPIAVAAAGAWLAETGAPVEDYLRDIEARPESVLAPPGNQSVERTWDLSLSRLKETSAGSYRLLQLCSLLAPEISLELIYGDRMAEVLRPFDPDVAEAAYRWSLVHTISRLALLKLDVANRRIHIHRLLQHVVRQRMTESEMVDTRLQVHAVLAAARPRDDVDNPSTWPRFQMIWPHIELAEAYDSREEAVRRLFIDRVRYVWMTGGIKEAREIAEHTVDRWRQLMNRLDTDKERESLRRQILHLQFNLGNILRDESEFTDSRALNELVLAEQTALLGANHPHTLMTAGSLSADLRALGLYANALEQDTHTYTAWSQHFGDEHPRTLNALNNLGASYRLVGDFRSAREHDQSVFQRSSALFGDEHPATLLAGANLGRDLREAGDYRGSIVLLEDLCERVRTTLGERVPRYYNLRTNLAVSLRSAGRAKDAARVLEEAYEQLNHLLGPDNPDTLACRLSRAVNLLSTGEVESAGTELREIDNAYGRFGLEDSHPHRLACTTNRAATARAAQDLRTARALAETASRGFTDVLGPEHPYTLAAGVNLAVVLADQHDLHHAREQFESRLHEMLGLLGPDHPDTVRCEGNVLLVRREMDGRRYDTEMSEVAAHLTALLGEKHPAVEALHESRYLHRIVDPHPF